MLFNRKRSFNRAQHKFNIAAEHIKVYSFHIQDNFNVESELNFTRYDMLIKVDIQWQCNRRLDSWWFG